MHSQRNLIYLNYVNVNIVKLNLFAVKGLARNLHYLGQKRRSQHFIEVVVILVTELLVLQVSQLKAGVLKYWV